MWFAWIADRKPHTFSPAWVKATAKYRAAQNQVRRPLFFRARGPSSRLSRVRRPRERRAHPLRLQDPITNQP